MSDVLFTCLQLEVFRELNAAAINASIKADSAPSASTSGLGLGMDGHDGQVAGQAAVPDVWKTPEDRQFLLALLLHCADISNAVKPFAIAEK